MFTRIYTKITEGSLNHYRKAALAILPISFYLLLFFFLAGHTANLFYSNLLLDIIPIPAFIGHLLSSSTYIGGAMDLWNDEQALRSQRWGTLLGSALGLAVGITVSIFLATGPITFLSVLSHMIFTMRSLSAFAGIGNRLGGLKRRPKAEKWGLVLACSIGLILGTTLFFTVTGPMLSMLGIVTFVTNYGTLPVGISGILFVSMFTSTCMSGADYSSKAITFLRNAKEDQATIKDRYHEYHGSAIGAALCLAVAVPLIISQVPLVMSWLTPVLILIVASVTFSIIDGIFSRVGLTLDGLKEEKNNEPTPLFETTWQKIKKYGPALLAVITGVFAMIMVIDACKKALRPASLGSPASRRPSLTNATTMYKIVNDVSLLPKPRPGSLLIHPSPTVNYKDSASTQSVGQGLLSQGLYRRNSLTPNSSCSTLTSINSDNTGPSQSCALSRS
jgi:uncharacterized membrane protein HdeD (DUF308 family)